MDAGCVAIASCRLLFSEMLPASISAAVFVVYAIINGEVREGRSMAVV